MVKLLFFLINLITESQLGDLSCCELQKNMSKEQAFPASRIFIYSY